MQTSPIRHLLLLLSVAIGLIPAAGAQTYFQQEVKYTIQVTLHDKSHELHAFETIVYTNHSPDTLAFLYFHLWPNAYSDNNTALAKELLHTKGRERLFDDPALRGYIDSLNFCINNLPVAWTSLPGQPDICKIVLASPLQPGDSIHISTPFHVKIPKGVTSRLGHIGESYQISQWYPKPAVYDLSGWHPMPYLDQGEFYSEFGSFDVSITLPDNYVVGASGNLQSIGETERLNKLAADTSWRKTLSLSDTFPVSSVRFKTLRYTGSHIHDFAWFADKRFHVMKGSVKLPGSGREVTTWAMFTNQQASLWRDAIGYENAAIARFSAWNGDYPYQSFTAVQSALNAGAGMEYPGLTVVGKADDGYALDQVIAHEIGHSWFYSALGTDERRFPFLDESITSACEERYKSERYPGKKLWEVYIRNRKLSRFFHVDEMPVQRMAETDWLAQARNNLEQPIDLAAPDYTERNYNDIVYYKGALAFNYLRAYLGDSLFDACMHDYVVRWTGRHPQPVDLQQVFEQHTTQSLSWFFVDLLRTTKRCDYQVMRLDNGRLLVRNRGELVAPLVVAAMDGDSIVAEKWVDGFGGEQWIDLPPGHFTEIKIDPRHLMPELFRLNNNIRTSGIFRKADPFRAQLMFSLDDPDRRTILYIPSFNWNRENGFLVGGAVYNVLMVSQPVEYFLMPFYSFRNPNLAGYGKVSFNMIPYQNIVRLATFGIEATQFGAPGNRNYQKAKATLDIYFRSKGDNNPLRRKIFGYYIVASDLRQIESLQKVRMRSYVQFGYKLERTGLVNPFDLVAAVETNTTYQKTTIELHYTHSYYGKNRGLDIRLFAGGMLSHAAAEPLYLLAASGRSGRDQYLYEGFYPDRFSAGRQNFWSRQMTLAEGSLVSPLNDSLGYGRWLIAASFSSTLPGIAARSHVKPFVNIVCTDGRANHLHPSPFFFEAGIKTGIWNIFEVYIPLLVSGNIATYNLSFKDRIRFVLKLDALGKMGSF